MSQSLTPVPALDRPDLLTPLIAAALQAQPAVAEHTTVAEIDPDFADTAEFCERYSEPLETGANCVIIEGKRAGEVSYAACLVLAHTRIDVNSRARKYLNARKASFAPMDVAVELTGMEYGGITPIGLPKDWPLLIDSRVVELPKIVIGSGLRRSKIFISGAALAQLPGADVVSDLALEVPTA